MSNTPRITSTGPTTPSLFVKGRCCRQQAIGRATLVVEWNNRETGSIDARHAGVKINKTIKHKDMQLTYPQGKHRERLQRVGGVGALSWAALT
jgi:hypothetical protein